MKYTDHSNVKVAREKVEEALKRFNEMDIENKRLLEELDEVKRGSTVLLQSE
jgi:hypothetical protein